MSSAVTSVEEEPLEAVIFDMDGVVTRTARLHALAWKQLFDAFLRGRPAAATEDHRPFTERDYREHVDGEPLDRERLRVSVDDAEGAPVRVAVYGRPHSLGPGEMLAVPIERVLEGETEDAGGRLAIDEERLAGTPG